MANRAALSVAYSILLLFGRSDAMLQQSKPNDLMICRPVTAIFNDIGQGRPDPGLLQIFRGPPGRQGDLGNTGPPGITVKTDDEKVAAMIHDDMHALWAKLYQYQKELDELKGFPSTWTQEDKLNSQKCMSKFNATISVNNTCYLLIGGSSLSWNFKDAESNCIKLGGYLADLNSREIYEKLYDFVDNTFSTVVKAWTGMRYQNDKLVLTNGLTARHSKWMAYYPKKGTSSFYQYHTYVSMNLDSSSRIKGIENTVFERKYPYAICHFGLDGPLPTRSTTTTKPTASSDDFDYDSDYYDYYY